MRTRPLIDVALALLVALPSASSAQGRGAPPKWPPARKDTTPGYIIKEPLIMAYCSGCHVRDTSGRMERLSYLRKTPEGWETSIRRMAVLVGVKFEPSAARTMLKYLSNEQGLAPEESRAGRFEAERRQLDHRYTADVRTETTCKACHSLGRVITQRRTSDEWELLVATHRAYFPDVDRQTFRRFGPPAPGDTTNPGHPMDAAITHLSRALPLRSNDWSAWSATMRPPRIDGQWMLSGTEPGRGQFTGRMVITTSPTAPDEFTTRATYRYVNGGKVVTREGKSTVYTGYQWRGRSSETGSHADSTWREVLFVEPGWKEITGRWFKGAYDEFGMDVTMTRLGGSAPIVAAVAPRGLRTGAANQAITILGAHLPLTLRASDVDFGPGVHVERVARSWGDSISLTVRVDSAAKIGARDLFVAGASLRSGAVVFDKVQRVKVTPAAGMARVGGANFPRQYAQFEATGFHNGADGRPETPDDVEIGPVNVTWGLEEYGVTFDDDDLKFVGAIDASGRFTPNIDGPNPQRSGSRNNIGDVWVVATYKSPVADAAPMKARAHLLVTVPLYMRWESWRAAP